MKDRGADSTISTTCGGFYIIAGSTGYIYCGFSKL
jgi:hypothetical protein